MNDLTKIPAVGELVNALNRVRAAPLLFVVASIVDALFFVAYGFFVTPVSDKIVDHTVLIGNALSPLLASGQRGILRLLFTPDLRPLTGKLILLVLLFFALLYATYVIFQGTSWWLDAQIAKGKIGYRDYFLGFARINLLWLFCYILYKLADVFVSLRYLLIQKLAPTAPNLAGYVLLFLVTFLFIAAFVSYSSLSTRTIFRTPLSLLLSFLGFVLVILLATQFILGNLILLAPLAMRGDAALLFGLIVLFPIVSFLKVYTHLVMHHVRV